MKFQEIRGQNQIKEHLQNSIAQEKVSHAYIFVGEKLSGKRMLAEAFSATLLCKEEGRDACGCCHSCKQAMTFNNPDIVYVTHEKANITVDDVREQINATIDIKPYDAKHKIYIIEEAEKMNIHAQNALLKTIEEPPSYAVIILLAANVDTLLPTIRSRCIELNMESVSEKLIMRELMENQKIPDYRAQVYAAFAQGNFGKALEIATSEEFNNMKKDLVGVLRRVEDMDVYEIQQLVEDMKEDKKQVGEYLDLMHIWFKDVLLYKAMGSDEAIVFKDESFIIKKQAVALQYKGLNAIFCAIEDAEAKLRSNCNFSLIMELLLLKIKECYT